MNDFPYLRLHPVADTRHGWAALLLASPRPLDLEILARLFGEFGLFEALGTLPCILDAGGILDAEEWSSLLPAEQVILRVPAASSADAQACGSLQGLRQAGFHLVADGWPGDGQPLCPDIEAVALPAGQADQPGLTVRLAGRGGRHLALAVDTPALFDHCANAGFSLLAGNYPLNGDGTSQDGDGARHALVLQLLSLISRDADTADLEALIKQDAHLSYHLLRLVNSVAFALSTKITSFGQAIMILGRRQLQRWLQLLLYARPAGGGKSPLMPRAALRGAQMEALFAGRGRDVQERAFMAGIFSLLDRLLGMRLADVLAPLNIADDVVEALLERTGPLGPALAAIEAAELGQDGVCAEHLAAQGIDGAAWAQALTCGLRWAVQVSREA